MHPPLDLAAFEQEAVSSPLLGFDGLLSVVAGEGPPTPEIPAFFAGTTAIAVGLSVIVVVSLLFVFGLRTLARKRTPLGRIMELTMSEKHLMIPATVCLFTSSALQLLIPFYGGQFIKMLQSKEGLETHQVDALMLRVIVTAIVLSSFTTIRGYLYQLAGERVINKLRKRIFAALLRQEMAYFDSETSGQLISRLTNDAGTLQSAATSDVAVALRSTANLFMSLLILFIYSWKLTLAMLGVVPATSLLASAMGRLSRKVGKAYQEKLSDAGTVAGETLGNMRTIRAFRHGEDLMSTRFCTASDGVYLQGKKQALISGTWAGVVGLLFYMAFSVVLWFGARLVQSGDLAVDKLVSFILYTLSLSASIAMLGSVMPRFGTVMGATQKIFEMIERVPAIAEGKQDRGVQCEGLVEFDAVSFAYSTRSDVTVLSSVSFIAEPNQVVALVGPSGSGKSSCMSLLQRLYDVTGGTVRIDKVDVREFTNSYLRQHIAVVSQEPVLFAFSVRENVRFGADSSLSDEAMVEAAKLANCHGFITAFPDGYDTLVGERGIQLSGGQKQRVAIARALMANPTILLLDEATSALDSESEGVVQQALNVLMEKRDGRTQIVVAHRLSTVRKADLIVVLKDGSVAERGTHEELLRSQRGVYRELVQRQLADSPPGCSPSTP